MQSHAKPKPLTIIAATLQIIFALTSIYLAYQALTAPLDRSEFAAIRNIAIGLNGIIAMVFSLFLLICAAFLFKRKRWAYYLSIVFILLCMLILGVGDMETLIFELMPGSPLSVTSEILPTLIIALLIFSFRDFKKIKMQG